MSRHALAAPTKPKVKNALWTVGMVFEERVTKTAKPVVPGVLRKKSARDEFVDENLCETLDCTH